MSGRPGESSTFTHSCSHTSVTGRHGLTMHSGGLCPAQPTTLLLCASSLSLILSESSRIQSLAPGWLVGWLVYKLSTWFTLFSVMFLRFVHPVVHISISFSLAGHYYSLGQYHNFKIFSPLRRVPSRFRLIWKHLLWYYYPAFLVWVWILIVVGICLEM